MDAQTDPDNQQAKPDAQQENPANQQDKAADQQNKPAEQQNKPAEQKNKPAEQQKKPAKSKIPTKITTKMPTKIPKYTGQKTTPTDKPVKQSQALTAQVLKDTPLRSPAIKVLENISHTGNKLVFLEKFYAENSIKLASYEEFWKALLNILVKNEVPGVTTTAEYSPSMIIGLMNNYIDELKSRFQRYQLEIGNLCVKSTEMFTSVEILSKIEEHKKNVFALLESNEKQLDALRAENLQLKEERRQLQSSVDYTSTKISLLNQGQGDNPIKVLELEARCAAKDRLIATLRKDLRDMQSKNFFSEKRLGGMAKKLSITEEKNMTELAEIAQKTGITAALESAVKSMFTNPQKMPKEADCEKIIDEWNRLMKESIGKNKTIISDAEKEYKIIQDTVIKKENELQIAKKKSLEIDQEINSLNENYKLKTEEAKLLADSVEVISQQIGQASNYNKELKTIFEESKNSYNTAMDETVDDESPDRINGGAEDTPGAQDLEKVVMDKATAIQKSHSPLSTGGTTTPYAVVPSPHALTATPSPKTPFVSTSRFGYTDPKAKAFNFPPLACFQYEPAPSEAVVQSSSQEASPASAMSSEGSMTPGTDTVDPRYYPSDFEGRYLNFTEHWYETPPITKSVERRPHGMFTPTSVFERRHAAIRNLFGDDYESPGSPWGTGRKFHPDYDMIYPEDEETLESNLDQTIEWGEQSPPKGPQAVTEPRSQSFTSSSSAQDSPYSSESPDLDYPTSTDAANIDPRDYASYLHKKYVGHRNKAPPITESVDRRPHGMFTPRGVFRKRHASVRDLFGADYESPGSPWGTGKKQHPEHAEYDPYTYDDDIFDLNLNDSIEWAEQSPSKTPPAVIEPRFLTFMSSSSNEESPQSTYSVEGLSELEQSATEDPTAVIDDLFSYLSNSSESSKKSSPASVINRRYSPKSISPSTPAAVINRAYRPQLDSPSSPQIFIDRPYSSVSSVPYSPQRMANRSQRLGSF